MFTPQRWRPGSFGARVAPILAIVTCSGCGSTTSPPAPQPPPPPPVTAPPVLLDVVDVGNAGDASDLRVSFRGPGNDTGVSEYRVFVARSAGLSPGARPTGGTFHAEPRASGPLDVRLPATVTDDTGAPLVEGTAYVVFIQAWTGSADDSPFSGLSAPVTLATTDIVETLAPLDGGTGGVEVDPQGNIYVADFGTQLSGGTAGARVYRVTPAGDVSVWATGLSGASGNAFDSQGRLLQSNIAGNSISRIAADGTVSTLASGQGLSGPVGIAVGAGDTLIVANCGDNTLRKVAPDGTVSLFASGTLFNCPNGIALASDGNYYVANFGNGNLVRVTAAGAASTFVTLASGNLGHVTFGNGRLYVASRGTHQIYEVMLDGTSRLLAGTGARGRRDGPATEATLSFPNDIALSPDGGTLYFNDVDPGTSGTNVIAPSWVRSLKLDASGGN